MAKYFIAKAVSKHPGALRAKAKRLGMHGAGPIPATIMSKLSKSTNPTTRKEVTLAKTLKGFHH